MCDISMKILGEKGSRRIYLLIPSNGQQLEAEGYEHWAKLERTLWGQICAAVGLSLLGEPLDASSTGEARGMSQA